MRTTADRFRTVALDWEDVRFFAALARAGSLSAAARALRVSHATVGRRVAALEGALGRPLFERAARGYALTAAGGAVLQEAARMEASAEALIAEAAGAAGRARVRLTSTRALIDAFLLPRLGPLLARHPELELELVGEARHLSLARHEADLAVRLGVPRRGELVGRRVATLAYAFYGAPGVAAALAAGAPARRIGFDEGSAGLPEAAWLAEAYPDDRPAFRSNGFHSQQLAARAGLGVALLPCFMGDADAGLRRIDQGAVPPARPVWLLRRAGAGQAPHVRAVADFVVRVFGEARSALAGA